MVKRLLVALVVLLLVPSVVLAQNPDNNSTNIRALIGNMDGVLDEYNVIVNVDFEETAQNYWGANWRSINKTNLAYTGGSSAPATGYYDDAPAELRDMGYSFEALTTMDTSQLAPLDYASWIGALVSVPFLFVRGLKEIAPMFGPLGMFISWLLVCATWVTFVYFIEFMAKVVRTVYGLGRGLVELIGVLKP